MKLKIVKFDGFEDWYLIERDVHKNAEWYERADVLIPSTQPIGCKLFCKDSRICGYGGVTADIEGTALEMKDIASAIEGRYDESHKRCSVEFKNGKAFFGSPRNDNGVLAEISLEEADDLAKQIRDLLG